jgi:predicted dehydrogenase
MGRHDWKGAKGVADFEIVGGADLSEEARDFFHEETGAPVFPDFDGMLDTVKADAALIAVPDAFHAPFSIKALERGMDVICEKPMAETLEDARRMHQTAETQGKMLMIHHQLRWTPSFYYLHQAVARGDIGTVRSVDFDMFVRSDVCMRGYRAELKQLMLQDLGIHHFDLIRYITGQDVTSVYMRSWPSNEDHVAIKATTSVAGILELTGPVTASYRSSMRDMLDKTGYGCRATVTGSRGVLRMTRDGIQYQTHVAHEKEEPPQTILPEHAAEHNCWQAFADAMKTRTPTLTASGDNIKSIEVLFAAIESAETGKIVELD